MTTLARKLRPARFVVCHWEAVAVGKLSAYVFPLLNPYELYRVADQPVFLSRLLRGIALTQVISRD